MGDKGFLKIENVRTIGPPSGPQTITQESGSNFVYLLPGGQQVAGTSHIQVPAQSFQNIVQNQHGQSFIRLQLGQQLANGQAVIQVPAGQNVAGTTTYLQVPSNQDSPELQRLIQVPASQLQMPTTVASFTTAASDAGALPSNSQGKNLPVDYLLDNLIKKNEAILKKNDASLFKPRAREASDNTERSQATPVPTSTGSYRDKIEYPLMKHFLNTNSSYPASAFTPVPLSFVKPKEQDVEKRKEIVEAQFIKMENVVARPRSPTRRCNLLKTDESLFMNSFVESRVKKKDSWPLNIRMKDIVCGLSAKAKVMLPGKCTLALDGNVYWCNFCPFTSESKPAFLSHVMIHRFSCKHCKFQAFSRAEVVRHSSIKHCHYDEIPWFYCSFFHDNLKLHCNNNLVAEASLSERDYEFMDMDIETQNEEDDDLDDEDDDDDVSMMANLVKQNLEKSQQRNVRGTNHQTAESSSKPVQKTVVGAEQMTLKTALVPKPAIPKEAPSETWSTLSWICSYCDFVSQNYDLVKVHCSIMHPSETVSANQTKVSSEMAAQIKQLDSIRQVHLDKGQKEFLLSTESNSTTAKPKPKVVMTSPIVPVVAKSKGEPFKGAKDAVKQTTAPVKQKTSATVEPAALESKSATGVRSYECYNCHGQTVKIEELCSHLASEHSGEPFIGIDLRAVRLKQARFIVFCASPGCYFSTRFVQQYFEHYKTCYPDWNECEENNQGTHKSIVSTMKFAMKNMQVKLRGKLKSKWFYCQGCKFKATTTANVKKHVIQHHKTRKPSFQSINDNSRGKLRSTTYFCPRCKSFETQTYTVLQKHLRCTHNLTNQKLMYRQSEEDSEGVPDESVEPEDDSSVSMDADSEDQDVKPSPEELQTMMDAYLEGETNVKMASLGKSPRHAAVKAHLKLQNKGNPPHLHRCKICSYQCLGVNLMRDHLKAEHPNSDLISQDMHKKSQHQCANVYLCPQAGCRYCARVYADVQSHALAEHEVKMEESKELLKSIGEIKVEPFDLLESRGTYLCLYCKKRVIFFSTSEMRDHIKSEHIGQEIVMRDLIARKNHKPSHIYMCLVDSCSFSTSNRDLSIEHLQMHGDFTNQNDQAVYHHEDEMADENGDEYLDDENMIINEDELSLPPDIQVHVNEDNDMESDSEDL